MVNRNRQKMQMLVKRFNGRMRDLNMREIATKDVDRELETATEMPAMPCVAVAVNQHSRGRVCLQNSAYLWFEQD